MSSMTLVGGFVFDGTGTAPFRADVRVEDSRIVEVGADLGSAGAIDITGRTILPGLIDCHSHMAYSDMPGPDEAMSRSSTYNAFQAIAGLRATLAAGVTSVRDAGGADAGLRRAVDEGLLPGPRMLVSLPPSRSRAPAPASLSASRSAPSSSRLTARTAPRSRPERCHSGRCRFRPRSAPGHREGVSPCVPTVRHPSSRSTQSC